MRSMLKSAVRSPFLLYQAPSLKYEDKMRMRFRYYDQCDLSIGRSEVRSLNPEVSAESAALKSEALKPEALELQV